MFHIYFQPSFGRDRKIAEVSEEEMIWPVIKAFLDNRKFECYYFRTSRPTYKVGKKWHPGIWYDVGSHTEFFRAINMGVDVPDPNSGGVVLD